MGATLTADDDETGRHLSPEVASVSVLPELEDRISFLVHKINARIASLTRRLFAEHDLDLYSSRILVLLAERKEVRVGEMAEAMVLPQSTISHQLQRLEKQRFIRRRRTREDNRSVKVTLTPLGAEVAQACNAVSHQVYFTMIRDMDADDIRRLTGQLRNMFDALGDLDRPVT